MPHLPTATQLPPLLLLPKLILGAVVLVVLVDIMMDAVEEDVEGMPVVVLVDEEDSSKIRTGGPNSNRGRKTMMLLIGQDVNVIGLHRIIPLKLEGNKITSTLLKIITQDGTMNAHRPFLDLPVIRTGILNVQVIPVERQIGLEGTETGTAILKANLLYLQVARMNGKTLRSTIEAGTAAAAATTTAEALMNRE